MYEKLIVVLCNYSTVKPQLRHAVNPAIDKLKKYMSEAQSTKAYVLAMGKCSVLNSLALGLAEFKHFDLSTQSHYQICVVEAALVSFRVHCSACSGI